MPRVRLILDNQTHLLPNAILTTVYCLLSFSYRDAYQKVNALCLNPNTSDLQWMQLVENTNWPSMIRLILSAAWQTAFHVHYNRFPVLVHCSVSYCVILL